MFKKLKLGTKITSLLIVLVLLSVLAIGILSTEMQTSMIDNNLRYTTEELSSGMRQKIESFIDTHQSVLEAIANTNDLKSYNIEEQKSIIKEINKEHDGFALIFITDTKGQQVARSDDKNQFDDMSDRDYFKKVSSDKKTIISDVLISKTTGKPSVVIAIPIFNEQGEYLGILGATLDLSTIEEMRSEIAIGKTGYAFVTDSKGQILAHPDKTMAEERS